MCQYLIVKFKKNYRLIDSLAIEMEYDSTKDCRIRETSDNKLYLITNAQELEDYYCDIGPIYRERTYKTYLGRIIYKYSDIEQYILAACSISEYL